MINRKNPLTNFIGVLSDLGVKLFIYGSLLVGAKGTGFTTHTTQSPLEQEHSLQFVWKLYCLQAIHFLKTLSLL